MSQPPAVAPDLRMDTFLKTRHSVLGSLIHYEVLKYIKREKKQLETAMKELEREEKED